MRARDLGDEFAIHFQTVGRGDEHEFDGAECPRNLDGDGIGIQPVGVTIAVESERRNDGDNSFVEQVPEHFGIYLVNFAGVLLVDAFENAERDGFDGVGLRGAEIVRGKSL